MNVERNTNLNKRPYLRIHPTDTDHDPSKDVLFMDEQTKQITGPLITDGKTITISFMEPETYIFDCPDGLEKKFLVKSIHGRIGFTHEYYTNGDAIQSSPVRVDFIRGYFVAKDPKTQEEWKQGFKNSNIALRLRIGDTVT